MSRIRIVTATALVTGIGLFVLAATASAHVTVTAPGATRGGSDQEITFRVPVEKNADTVGLKVALPTDTPIASVLVEPVPGWTHTQKTVTLAKPIVTDDGDITQAVSEIDWTAASGHGLAPGEFGAFTIIAGQLPDAPTLTFKAIQLYSDGSQVAWTQTEAPGSTADLDDPAPVLTLAPADSAAAGPASSSAAPTAVAAAPKSSSNTGPVILGIVALVVAVAALGLAVVGRARASSPTPDGGDT